MINVDDAHVVRLKRNGQIFEILVDPDKALAYRNGETIPLSDILVYDDIFKDAKKGERAPKIKEVFGTDNLEEIVKIILDKGEIRLTADYLRKIKEQKYRKLIDMVHTNALNPQTKLPIPRDVIERAFVEAKINVDIHQSVNEQIKDVIRKLKLIMPITIGVKTLYITAKAQVSSKILSLTHSLGDILKQDWLNDGSVQLKVKVNASNYVKLVEKLAKYNDLINVVEQEV